jgi:uncharacterized membrane protein SpoIIM required for sporulation
MKETRFIAQNKEKWLESETLLNDPVKDPEKLSTLFTQVVDDLSYSRTYYQNRSVRVYLNKIAREYFSIIYGHKKEKKNRFKLFWSDELPQIILHCKRPLLISLIIFLVSAAIGVFSGMKDPQFTSSILSESYVAMTKKNIENGDPMAVYKEGHQVDMFLGITLNNLMVAFRTYVLGVFLSIGTIASLLYNGIMVGCFQYFFVERGLLAESALTIWLHGTLEISSIILAGGAGLTLGSGLIFPGTYSRVQAFQISAMRSLKLMLGITPIFVLAAIIESFLTRYTEIPDVLRLILILLSAGFIIGYFVVYPWYKSKRGFEHPLVEVKLPATSFETIRYDRIKSNAEVIKDAFLFYKINFNKLIAWISFVSLLVTAASFYFENADIPPKVYEMWWQYFFDDLFFALKTPSPIYIVINSVGNSLIIYRVLTIINKQTKNTEQKRFTLQSFIQTVIVMAMIYVSFYYLEGWGVFLTICGFFMILILAFTQLTEDSNLLYGFSRTWSLSAANFGQVLGLQVILMLMSFSFLMILSAPILYMNTTILQWNFAKSDLWAKSIVHFVELFIKIIAFNLIVPLLAASAASMYFSLGEIISADNLKKAIANVGTRLSKSGKR